MAEIHLAWVASVQADGLLGTRHDATCAPTAPWPQVILLASQLRQDFAPLPGLRPIGTTSIRPARGERQFIVVRVAVRVAQDGQGDAGVLGGGLWCQGR